MTTLGLPTAMFWVFVATVLAGSLGAIHYVVAHVILGRPFAEIPPPVLREGGLEPGAGAGGEAGGSGASGTGSEGTADGTGAGGEGGGSARGAGEDPDAERADG